MHVDIFNTVILSWFMLLFKSKAVLSQWKPRDAAVNCTEIFSGSARSSLRQHVFLVNVIMRQLAREGGWRFMSLMQLYISTQQGEAVWPRRGPIAPPLVMGTKFQVWCELW